MEIQNFKLANGNDQYFVAEFSIAIPEWHVVFHRFKIRRSKKGALFLASPCFCEEDAAGEKLWRSFIEFSKEKKTEFDKKIMELVLPMLDKDLPF